MEQIENCEFVIDGSLYRQETPLVKKGRRRGKKAVDGKICCFLQGAASFRLFGVEALLKKGKKFQ